MFTLSQGTLCQAFQPAPTEMTGFTLRATGMGIVSRHEMALFSSFRSSLEGAYDNSSSSWAVGLYDNDGEKTPSPSPSPPASPKTRAFTTRSNGENNDNDGDDDDDENSGEKTPASPASPTPSTK